MKTKTLALLLTGGVFALPLTTVAKTVKVDIPVVEKELAVDNAGTMQAMWTFGGTIPGPLVRVKQGDVVDFTLTNLKSNKQSHSMDFHAARVDVLDEFAPVSPGQSKDFQFRADYPGVFIYHCGAEAMSEHIARGMYGVIIVDPKEGYSEDYPKPDREYVIVQGDLFKDGTTPNDITQNVGKAANLINGKIFHYDPVHDQNASLALESKPGERVRFYFVNAQINDSVAFHPIAGIWDRVWDNGNPKNVSYGMQTYDVAPAHAVTLDLISPGDRPTNNALVDHQMKNAQTGAITVLMNHSEADPESGRGSNLIIRE
ncbi:multicopper oxidase domain-containing protein [Paremcibacter congregatus]|uniref:Copper-containing nitrite reductase n=1 Tax=Paremcibacter congregatus TaxID=2043170 RepID=A0A2G4YR06_9PROT|nr:multicopper oxidase domain-containing protein [Paremcibacter congregatus]PHZ84700.1 nitrite reductase [Paremcibacter congregatus]QDE28894.1 nitrite reductase [Paremcibacter congregatus]